MAKMYFSFLINLPDSVDDTPTPQVDYTAFMNEKEDMIIQVSCNGESDFGIFNGRYSGRFKGLEILLERCDGHTVHEWADIIDDDVELLKNSKPYEIGLYFPDKEPSVTPVSNDINIDIEVSDDNILLSAKHVDTQYWT